MHTSQKDIFIYIPTGTYAKYLGQIKAFFLIIKAKLKLFPLLPFLSLPTFKHFQASSILHSFLLPALRSFYK